MSKVRPEPWICEGTRAGGRCAWRAHSHCPACDKIYCDMHFGDHEKGCKIYTGTDQCLCIWPMDNEWPACGHDIRGPKGAKGHIGLLEGESAVEFEGVEIKVEPCGHCGAKPESTWLAAELKFYSQLKCNICGVRFEVRKLQISHVKDGTEDRWVAMCEEREPFFSVSKETPSGYDFQIRVHEKCLNKAFPYGWQS